MNSFFDRLRFLGSEVVLGILITVLSIGTASASYLGAMADSDQNKYEIQGMRALNDGNTTYLEANQNLSQDYAYFDSWYTNDGVDQDRADYYLEQMSDELATLATSDTMDEAAWEAYELGIFADSLQLFDRADASFTLATAFDEKGDSLQLVMLFMALGLAFAAWASLLDAESNLRPMFAIFAIVTLVAALVTYFGIPAIPAIDIPLDPFA
ncbi:MAG: hypothetical protein CVU44_21655 [Chloroflexi bacterium HGW-Chloroflexi-6]|nr:MAG: hypothetical protein CVU44_21655 [Chloroflexi bacterium HGW-Chloroflexi-6]